MTLNELQDAIVKATENDGDFGAIVTLTTGTRLDEGQTFHVLRVHWDSGSVSEVWIDDEDYIIECLDGGDRFSYEDFDALRDAWEEGA